LVRRNRDARVLSLNKKGGKEERTLASTGEVETHH